jgi:superfamily II DNA or RNA helicase
MDTSEEAPASQPFVIGTKVVSHVHQGKGKGTIIGFSGFDDTLVDVIFDTGEKLVCRVEDLHPVTDPVSRLKSNRFSTPDAFLCRLFSSKLAGQLTDKALIASVNFKIKPLPHQLLAVDFVMNRFKPRCLIADEVGLGKTIEALLVYQEYKLRGMAKRTLIVVPSGLILQWHEEIVSKFNEHFVIYSTDYVKTLKQSYGDHTNVWKLNDKIIVSMDTVKPYKVSHDLLSETENARREWHNQHMFEDLVTAGFDIVIIDEAHKLSKKSDQAESLRFKLGKRLSRSVPVFILLTATPHQGDEDLFFHLLQLVDPILFSDRSRLTPILVKEACVRNKKQAVVDFNGNRIFKHRVTSFCNIIRNIDENADEYNLYELITQYASTCYNLGIQKNNRLLIMLVMLFQRIAASSSFAIEKSMKKRKRFLQSLMMVQTDGDERMDGNDQETDPLVDDPDMEALIQEQVFVSKEDLAHEIGMVSRCVEAAQKLTAVFKDKKFQVLLELIEEIRKKENDPDLKLIVFTEFRPTQDAIIQFLEKFGYTCAYINGSLSRERKNEQVRLFKEEKQILVSTDAGGEGINLQFCHCLVNFDLPWNPSRIEQRIGRIDRIGQNHHCLIFNFRLKDTIEDHVREILENKLDLIKEQFGEDKYADILDVLEDEFSFEKIYAEAIHTKLQNVHELNTRAARIFERAKEIIDKGDLLIPFNEPDEKTAETLISHTSHLVQQMIFSFLGSRQIPVNEYKTNPGVYHFQNPFGTKEFRYITFDPEVAFESDRHELLNIEHPLVKQVQSNIRQTDGFGETGTMRADINKFSGIQGYWFVFLLTVTNNIDRTYHTTISIFMEDESFCNNRISNYLNKGLLSRCQMIQNHTCTPSMDQMTKEALEQAKEKATAIFLATKLDWIKDIDAYEEKAARYFSHRETLVSQIKVDNIRESRKKQIQGQRKKEIASLAEKKIVVPELILDQVAYLEFT